MVSLDPDQRAALIARIEANTRMPERMRTRILSALSQEQVPARLLRRLSEARQRQGG
jgi:hypothetical protein